MKRLKQIGRSILALTLTLLTVTPLLANASGAGGNNGGYNYGNTGSTAQAGQASASKGDSGYRFYVVDKNFNVVSTVYDFVYKNPYQVAVWCTGTYGQYYSSVPSKGIINKDGGQYLTFAHLQNYCGASDAPPIPFNTVRTENGGEKFKAWFLKGLEGEVLQGGGNSGTAGQNISQNKTTVSASQAAKDYLSGTNKYNLAIITGCWSLAGTYESVDCHELSVGYEPSSIKSLDVARAEVIYKRAKALQEKLYNELKDKDALINPEGTDWHNSSLPCEIIVGKQDVQRIALAYSIHQATSMIYEYYADTNYGDPLAWKLATNLLVGDANLYSLKVQADINAANDPYNQVGGSYWTSNNLNPLTINEDQIIIDIDTLINNNIPLEGEGYEEGVSGCPAEVFLNNTEIWNIDGFDNALDALFTKEYYLIVEPLTWVYLCDSSGYNKVGRIYGTPYNIANYYANNPSAQSLGNGASKGGWMVNVLHSHYITMANKMEHPELKLNGNPMNASAGAPSTKYLTDYLANMNNTDGVGLHVYIGTDFERSGTSTYDEPKGDTPAPSPDDGNKIPTQDKEQNKVANIVKFYEWHKADGSIIRSNYTREITPTQINIEDEQSYRLTDWYTSPTFKRPTNTNEKYDDYKLTMNSVKSGTSEAEVKLESPETTLYVLLVKQDVTGLGNVTPPADGLWTLEQSEISKGVEVAALPSTNLSWWFGTYTDHGEHYCGGCRSCGQCHGCGDEDCDGCCPGNCWCPGHGCTWKIKNSDLKFKLTNTLESSMTGLLATQSGYPRFNNEVTETRTNIGEHYLQSDGHQYKFTIYRGSDALSQVGYISGGASVSGLGFNTLSTKTRPTRLSTDYTTPLPILLKCDSPDYTTILGCDWSSANDTEKLGEFMKDNNGEYFVDGSVKIKVYSGVSTQTHGATADDYKEIKTFNTSSGENESGRRISAGINIKFNPYINMTTCKVDGSGNFTSKQNVNVLSEWVREINPDDYAEVYFVEHPENLKVQSQMWALDTGLTNGTLGWNKINQVLKGGAAYQLTTKDNNQNVRVTTYQVILNNPNDARWQLSGDTNQAKLQNARDEHNAFVAQVIDGFSTLNVELWVNKDTSASYAWSGDGFVVTRGTDITKLANTMNGTASTETKYYLNEENSPNESTSDAQSAGLCATKGNESEIIYTIKSDKSGNVTITGTDGTSVVFAKHEGVASIPGKLSGTLAKVELRTNIIEKVLTTLERNTGNDSTASWVTDGRWYNEIVDGIQVIVKTTNLSVGFDRQTQARTTVLDPKLVPVIDSKNPGEREAFLLQYKCSDTCGNQTKPLVVGQFKGKDISMVNLDKLFTSRKFYVTDGTVQNSR